MTQEEKSLLLQDLCARLPYGLIVDIKYSKENDSSDRLRICSEGSLTLNTDLLGLFVEDEIYLKPYLRSLSSMTEEEQFQLGRLMGTASYNMLKGDYSSLEKLLKYVYKNHIDYFNLIPMGLAFEATEGMYK